ncbi:MAG: methyltransferase, partial [Verrucomicrobiota bacterium]
WQRRDKKQPVGNIGFLKNGTRHSIVDVPTCPIGTDAINEALPEARRAVRQPITASEKKILKQKGGTILLRDVVEGVVSKHDSVVTERVGDASFQFKAGDFFQNNPYILPVLVEYVSEQIKADSVRYLIDAYCGVGLFAVSLGKRFEAVAGVEVSESAVLWARVNAEINQVKNAQFISGSAEAIFADVTFPGEETAMVIDPPRKGCDQVFLNQLFAFAPKRLVYVSCDPATQARDLKILVEGGYHVERIQPFDLFPQTRHIETVATLERHS